MEVINVKAGVLKFALQLKSDEHTLGSNCYSYDQYVILGIMDGCSKLLSIDLQRTNKRISCCLFSSLDHFVLAFSS